MFDPALVRRFFALHSRVFFSERRYAPVDSLSALSAFSFAYFAIFLSHASIHSPHSIDQKKPTGLTAGFRMSQSHTAQTLSQIINKKNPEAWKADGALVVVLTLTPLYIGVLKTVYILGQNN